MIFEFSNLISLPKYSTTAFPAYPRIPAEYREKDFTQKLRESKNRKKLRSCEREIIEMMMSALASPTSFANTNTFSSSVHANHHPRAIFAVSPSIFPVSPPGDLTAGKLRRYRKISCEVALKSDSAAVDSSSCSSSSSSVSSVASSAGEENEESGGAKIGARVRVTAPLKVYHVPKVPELDITGMEGQLKAYVGLWKGKRISANLPFKIEFVTEIEGRGKVKFSAHLKEDEFEYVD